MYADAVESANIVGYNTVTVKTGSTTALGVQFSDVASSDGISIKKIVTVANPLGSTSAISTADQIWTFNGYTWTKYYYYKRGATTKWCLAGTTTEISDDITLKPGESFYFVRSDADTSATTQLTLSGGVVPLANTVTYEIAPGSTTAMAFPWPEVIKIKDFNNFNPDPRGSTSAISTADQIWTFDGYTWTKYYFYKRGATIKWCLAGSTTEIGDDVLVNPGSAFFFVRSDAATENVVISFTK